MVPKVIPPRGSHHPHPTPQHQKSKEICVFSLTVKFSFSNFKCFIQTAQLGSGAEISLSFNLSLSPESVPHVVDYIRFVPSRQMVTGSYLSLGNRISGIPGDVRLGLARMRVGRIMKRTRKVQKEPFGFSVISKSQKRRLTENTGVEILIAGRT